MYGDLAGKEGFVKEVIDGSDVVVAETRHDLAQPLVIVEGQDVDAAVPAVSILRIIFLSVYSLATSQHS
jgi:hypothetical protein